MKLISFERETFVVSCVALPEFYCERASCN